MERTETPVNLEEQVYPRGASRRATSPALETNAGLHHRQRQRRATSIPLTRILTFGHSGVLWLRISILTPRAIQPTSSVQSVGLSESAAVSGLTNSLPVCGRASPSHRRGWTNPKPWFKMNVLGLTHTLARKEW